MIMTRVTKICLNCGKIFNVPLSRSHKKFCSSKCYREYEQFISTRCEDLTWRAERKIIEIHDNKCMWCGEESNELMFFGMRRRHLIVHRLKYSYTPVYITICPECYKWYSGNPEMYESKFWEEFIAPGKKFETDCDIYFT
jgi:hypothetical protein